MQSVVARGRVLLAKQASEKRSPEKYRVCENPVMAKVRVAQIRDADFLFRMITMAAFPPSRFPLVVAREVFVPGTIGYPEEKEAEIRLAASERSPSHALSKL